MGHKEGMSNNTPLDPIPEGPAFENFVPGPFEQASLQERMARGTRRMSASPGIPMIPCSHSEMTIDSFGQGTCDICHRELTFDRILGNWVALRNDLEMRPMVNTCSEPRLGPLARIARRLFPMRHLEYPEFPGCRDGITSVVVTEFSFLDRLRLLFSGRLETKVHVAVTVPVGRTATAAQSVPRPPRWMGLD